MINYPQRWLREHQATTSNIGWHRPVTYEVLKGQKGLGDDIDVESVVLLLPENVKVGESIELNFKITPRFKSNVDFTLTISNESLCTYDKDTNKLTFNDTVGDVSITIKILNSNASDTKTIKILKDSAGFIIDGGNSVEQGKQKKVQIKLFPEDTTDTIEKVYTTSNIFKVLKLSNGYSLFSDDIGTFDIIVKTKNAMYRREVYVYEASRNILVESVSFDVKEKYLHKESIDINPSFTPLNATEKDFDIILDDQNIAVWDKAKMQIHTLSKNGITSGKLVMRVGGASFNFKINVNDTTHSQLDDIKIIGMPSEFNVGGKYPFTIEAVPSNVDISDYVISQSNDNIQIKDGVLHALKEGETSLTFTSAKNNFTKNTLIKIKPAKVLIERFEVDIADTIAVNAIIFMNVNVFPSNAERLYTVTCEGNLQCEGDVIIGGNEYNAPSGVGKIIITANDGSGVVFTKDINVLNVPDRILYFDLTMDKEVLNDGTRYPIGIKTYPENPSKKDIHIKVDGVLKLDGTSIYANQAGFGTIYVEDKFSGASESIRIKVYDKNAILTNIYVTNIVDYIKVNETAKINFVTVPEFARIPPYNISINPSDTLSHNKFMHTLTALKLNNPNEMTSVTISIPSFNKYTYTYNVAIKDYVKNAPNSFDFEIPECLYAGDQNIYRLKINFYDANGNIMLDNVDTRITPAAPLWMSYSSYNEKTYYVVREDDQYYLYVGASFSFGEFDFSFYLTNGFKYGAVIPVYNQEEHVTDFNMHVELVNQTNSNFRYKENLFALGKKHAIFMQILPKKNNLRYFVKVDKKCELSRDGYGRYVIVPLELGTYNITIDLVGIRKTLTLECIDFKNVENVNFDIDVVNSTFTEDQTIDLKYAITPTDAVDFDKIELVSPYLEHVSGTKYKIIDYDVESTSYRGGSVIIKNDHFTFTQKLKFSSKVDGIIVPALNPVNGVSYLVNTTTPIKFFTYLISDGYPIGSPRFESTSTSFYFVCDNPNISIQYTKENAYSNYGWWNYFVKDKNSPNVDFNIKVFRVGDDVLLKEFNGKVVDINTPIKDIVLTYTTPIITKKTLYTDDTKPIVTRYGGNPTLVFFHEIPYKGGTVKNVYTNDGTTKIEMTSDTYERGHSRYMYNYKVGDFELGITYDNFTKLFKFKTLDQYQDVTQIYLDHPVSLPIKNDIVAQITLLEPSDNPYITPNDINIYNARNCEVKFNGNNGVISIKPRDNTNEYYYEFWSRKTGKRITYMGGTLLPEYLNNDIKLDTPYIFIGKDIPLNYYVQNGSNVELIDVYDTYNYIKFDLTKIADGIVRYSCNSTTNYNPYSTSIVFKYADGKIVKIPVKIAW